MRQRTLLLLAILLAGMAVLVLLLAPQSESEQQYSGDNCVGCHGNRYTQRVVITEAQVPDTIAMGEEDTVDITVLNDCRNQGNVFTGQYSSLNQGTDLWLGSQNGLVMDKRGGDPASIGHINSQQEASSDWTITGTYDYAVEELNVDGVLEPDEELTITAKISNSGGGSETLELHIEGRNSHENEVQITDDSYSITVTAANIDATVAFFIDGDRQEGKGISLGPGEEEDVVFSWTAVSGEHDFVVRLEGLPAGESDTGNNELEEQIFVGGWAELFVQAMELVSEDPVRGQLVELRTLVANSGEKDASLDYVVEIESLEVANGSFSVDADSTRIHNFFWDSSGYGAGDHQLTIILDPEDLVKEYNEDNNTLSLQVSLKEPPSKPDAAVMSILLSSDEVFQLEEFYFLAQVQNLGDGWLNTTLRVLVDEGETFDPNAALEAYQEQIMLEPLGTRELNHSLALQPGNWQIAVNLSESDVEEGTLDNNQRLLTQQVKELPLLRVQGLELPDRERFLVNDPILLKGVIENQGDYDAVVGYRFLVDSNTLLEESVTVPAGENVTLDFVWTPEEVRGYTVTFIIHTLSPARLGVDRGSVVVDIQKIVLPSLEFPQLRFAPLSPVKDEKVYFTASLNYPDQVTVLVELIADGTVVDSQEAEFFGNYTVLLVWELPKKGEREIKVKVSSLVLVEPLFRELLLEVAEANPDQDSTVTVVEESDGWTLSPAAKDFTAAFFLGFGIFGGFFLLWVVAGNNAPWNPDGLRRLWARKTRTGDRTLPPQPATMSLPLPPLPPPKPHHLHPVPSLSRVQPPAGGEAAVSKKGVEDDDDPFIMPEMD